MRQQNPVYDLAVSFAGEQRPYVEQVVEACKGRGLTVLYDRDRSIDLWGRNLIIGFRGAYNGDQARYVAPFLSREYLAKPYPMDEFRAMLVPAIENPDDYILPVTFGDVVVPADLLSPAIGLLRCEDYTPQALAQAFEQRIRGPVTSAPPSLRMPGTTSRAFSKYRELEQSFRYLTEQFKVAAAQMEGSEFVCTVRNSESELKVRVEHRGTTLYGIDIQLGGMGRDDVLNFALSRSGWLNGSNGSNGTAAPVFDRSTGAVRLEMHDYSVLGTTFEVRSYSKEELFEALWNRLVDQVQQITDSH
ncbi:TIR domain-containing protein [Streptomyces sp. MMBL 11-3]|uniref:TIR domain-containing protein n=1 Tax=Streptomyces sp. MMBL 11-3 TaxID=3382639 RepID=UPI0039B430B0